MTKHVPSMRIPYELNQLGDRDVDDDPIRQFQAWFDEVCETSVAEANAMVISTVDDHCRPSARTILMKGFDERGIVFFTNYDSQKGRDIAANPYVSALFYWPTLQRQVRWTGKATKIPADESDAYFHERPRGHQVGSAASPQSAPIPNQRWLAERFAELEAGYGDTLKIPRPEHWGGYRIEPETIEFWQGRENRLHDRIRYTRVDHGSWTQQRLAP
jgi:pyridoxamine 5'-phosphate oxidase